MKRPLQLLALLLLEEGRQCSIAVERDVQEIERRSRTEGMSFLTITLPVLSDALERGLREGRITRSDYIGFRSRSKRGSLPALLSGFFMRVFDEDGSLLDDPCIDSIRAIRQVSRLFKKVLLPCSQKRVKNAFERYVSNDENVRRTDSLDDRLWRIVVGYLWSDLESFSERTYCSPGKFGSGATAERMLYHQRYTVRKWPARAEQFFPASAHISNREDSSDLESVEFLNDGEELPVRVVSVPKTLKTPRIIAVEPSYAMLQQQSVAVPLMDYLEKDYRFRGSIRFRDQSRNREYARLGSIDGSYATIDLSDASDLISNDLVFSMFERVCPTFLGMVQACRTKRAQVDRRLISLRKFASMGSAMCFPMEAMAFFSILVYSICRTDGVFPSATRIRKISAMTSVYGDDIIVPSRYAAGLIDDLESFGLRVNRAKTFTSGFFRESCGGDYYKGHDVTPVYIRALPVSINPRTNIKTLISCVETSNLFYMKGYWSTAQLMRDWIFKDSREVFPRSTVPTAGLTYSSLLFNTNLRWCKKIHRYKYKTLVISSKRVIDPFMSVSGAMLYSLTKRDDVLSKAYVPEKSFSTNIGLPFKYLERRAYDGTSPMPYAINAKRRWCLTDVSVVP